MKSRLRWPNLTFSLLAALAVFPTHGSCAEGSFDRTLKVTGAVELEVTTGSGGINVRAGEAASVRVHGTIRASEGWLINSGEAEKKVRALETNPPIEQSGNFIRIGRIEDPELRRNVSLSLEIVTPAETRLKAHTGSGSQTISGISGPVNAGTGSGGVKITSIGSEVRVETGSGNIQLESIKGEVRARTGSGYIRGAGIAGAITAGTGSGDVKLQQTAAGSARVDTGSGNVELEGLRGSLVARTGSGTITAEGAPEGGWSLSTGSGSVIVRLPANAAFDLDAHTSSGHVSADNLPITLQGTIRRGQLRGKVRGGGPRIELETGSGNIRIE